MNLDLPRRPHSISESDWEAELVILSAIIAMPDPQMGYTLDEFLSEQPPVSARIAVDPSSSLHPKPVHAFGNGVGLDSNTEYEVSNRGRFITNREGAICTVIVEDPSPSHPDLNPRKFAPEGRHGSRRIIHVRSQSTQITVFDTKKDGRSFLVHSCNRDPQVRPGQKLPRKTRRDEADFGKHYDRGHLEEREAGGGPWGINLDAQSNFSNTGKTRAWFKKMMYTSTRIMEAHDWLMGASGIKAYKGVVDVTSIREFESYAKALVKLLPGRVTVITKTDSFTNPDGTRGPSRVTKEIRIDRRNYLPRTSHWRIEAGF